MDSKIASILVGIALCTTGLSAQTVEPEPVSLTLEGELPRMAALGGTAYQMESVGTLGIVSGDYSRTFIDLSDPKSPQVRGHINLQHWAAWKGVLAGNLYFYPRIGADHRWEVLEIDRFDAPEVVDILPENIKSLLAEDGAYEEPWLYLGCKEDGVAIVNLADPDHPTLANRIGVREFLPEDERSSELIVNKAMTYDARLTDNGFLVVVGSRVVSSPAIANFLSTVDIRTPHEPRIVDFIELGTQVNAAAALGYINGSRIFTPINGGMVFHEVSDEGLLSKVGEIIPENRGSGWFALMMGLHGDTLYTRWINFLDLSSQPITAYDISDIGNPQLLEWSGDPIAKTTQIGQVVFVFVYGDTLYYGGMGSIFGRDLQEEGLPVIAKLQTNADGFPVSIGGEGSILQSVSAIAGEFSVFDFRRFNAPDTLSTTLKDEPYLEFEFIDRSTMRSNFANFGNYVLANRKIYDIIDPSSLEFVEKLTISIPGVGGESIPQEDISVRQHFAHSDGVYVLVEAQGGDSTVPYLLPYAFGEAEPLQQIAAIPLATTPQVAALGDRYLVVGSGARVQAATEAGTGTVAVYDVSDPALPRLHSTIETGKPDAVAIDGERLYVAVIGDLGDQNIFAYDILDDGSITQLPHYISLDQAFADYSEDFVDQGFFELALQAAETFLIARDGVLYGAFHQKGNKGMDPRMPVGGNSIATAFLADPFDSSISYYRTKNSGAGNLLGLGLWEDRMTLNLFWGQMRVHQVPLPHDDPDADVEPRDILPDTALEGTLAFPGEVDTYRFDALPQQEVTVAVEAAEGATLDPIVELVDGLGKLLAVNDDGPQRPHALLEFTLPEEGRDFNSPFGIRVTAPSGPPKRTVGDYSITLTLGEPPVIEPTPTPTPIITAEDFELSTIQTVRRTNGAPVTFTIQVRANPERDARDWRVQLTAEVDWAGAALFEPPTIDPPTVSFPGTATLTPVPSADFLGLRHREAVNVDVSARLVLGGDEPDDPIKQTLDRPLLVDLIPAHLDMGLYEDIRGETVFREPTQMYVTTTSELSENLVGDTVRIYGRLSPFNPVASFIDVSLDVEATDRTVTLKDAVYVNTPSGDFEASFEVEEESELGTGDWVVQSKFDKERLRYNPVEGKSPKLHIPVGILAQSSAKVGGTDGPIPGVGRAVVAFGPAPYAMLETGWQAMYESAMSILQARRFTETTLKGFCAAKGSSATLADLQNTLAASGDADLFTLVLAGRNDSDTGVTMKLSDSEALTPSQIGPLVKARHDALEAAGREGQTVVIIDTDRAGLIREEMRQNGFERFVDGPDGYVLTCTGNGLYNLAFNAMDEETGEFVSYLRFLIDAIAKGYALGDAHEQAISSLTRLQGGLVLSYPQPIRSEMSTELRGIFLGSSFLPDPDPRNFPDRNAPRIVETCASQTLDEDDVPLLFVVAEDESTTNTNASQLSVYAVITAPPDGLHPPAETVVALPYEPQTERHELMLNDFPRAQFGDAGAGDYAVGLYVKDAAGNRSTVSSLTITTLDTSVSTWGRF